MKPSLASSRDGDKNEYEEEDCYSNVSDVCQSSRFEHVISGSFCRWC